ncbi:GlxA family transcriptional regulator [Pseudoalteromonas piratica]|uniref:HTH araC/xylS-type domain-containing protein n=1 Tax=Pseudoalteromonas piratica TaxID=1348114 RepID=A0A0A7EKZ7_9GAMM|nr:helix-turn-helix domain-containing protein [Pseudoalteromonas piratica]AIY66746.1 hypothetical protein OM33_16620 [Pseudoalteromonas piratica]
MKEVVIVAFEGISLFHLSVPIAIFADAVLEEKRLFNVRVCSETNGKINSANGLGINIENDPSIIHQADIIIIPSWQPEKVPSPNLIKLLVDAHNNKKLIVGLCLGAYALAYSGLLKGKKATTHWKYGDDFKTKFPQTSCDINPLYLAENNIITSAGSAAAIDCCLYIVRHYYGVKTANKIARVMVSSPERSGGQKQYIENPTIEKPRDERIATLISFVLQNITYNHTLESAAAFCMMSTRSFSRNFKSSNGISFTSWLINLRLNKSLELLESTHFSVTEISERTGFSSEQIFRKHFNKRFDTSPTSWRKLFNSSLEQ